MFEDGLSYPFRGDWFKRTLIGGILAALSVLLLPAFLVMGYLVRVLKTTVSGADEPPEFDDWGGLFVDGLVGTAIGFVYSIVPFFVFGAVGFVLFGIIGIAGGSGASGGELIAGFSLLAFLLLAVLFIPVVFCIYYVVPAALTNYAIEGGFGAAFDFGTMKPILLSTEYLVAVVAPLLIAVLLWIATSILSITIIGLLLVPFVQFYGQVAVFRMFGSAFGTVAGRQSTTPSTETTAY